MRLGCACVLNVGGVHCSQNRRLRIGYNDGGIEGGDWRRGRWRRRSWRTGASLVAGETWRRDGVADVGGRLARERGSGHGWGERGLKEGGDDGLKHGRVPRRETETRVQAAIPPSRRPSECSRVSRSRHRATLTSVRCGAPCLHPPPSPPNRDISLHPTAAPRNNPTIIRP